MIPNTCPNLSNIVHPDFELGRVMQTMTAADPGITELLLGLLLPRRQPRLLADQIYTPLDVYRLELALCRYATGSLYTIFTGTPLICVT